MTSKKSEIVQQQENDPLAIYDLPMDLVQLRNAFIENIGSQQIDVGHLDRAVNPSGKSTKWEIPGIEEEPESVGEITGIIVYHKLSRAFWPGEYKGGGDLPQCSSRDGNTGEGMPGGDCWGCQLAKGRTVDDDENIGQTKWEKPLCRKVKQLFIRRPGDLLPTLFNATPANTKEVDRYMLRLLNKGGKSHHHVVTKIRLTSAVSASGFDYAKYVLSVAEYLPPTRCEEQDAYKAMIEPMLRRVEIAEADVSDSSGEPF